MRPFGSQEFIAYIGGLMNDEAAQATPAGASTAEPPPTSKAHGAWEYAQERGISFYYVPIQNAQNPNPTMTEMGDIVGNALMNLQFTHECAGTVISSSVGANATLQAFANNTNLLAPNAWVTVEGVFDALGSIPEQAATIPGGLDLYNQVAQGIEEFFPLPVQSGGTFSLRRKHIVDRDAFRWTKTPGRLRSIFQGGRGKAGSCLLITAEKNRLSPPDVNLAFRNAIRPSVQIEPKYICVVGASCTGPLLKEILTDVFKPA